MKRKSTICSVVAGLAMLSACNDKPVVERKYLRGADTKLEETAREAARYTMNVGDYFRSPGSLHGFYYGGMPTPFQNYTIILITGGLDSTVSVPLCFPIDQKQISLEDSRINILDVKPNKIEFTYEKLDLSKESHRR